MASRAFDYCVKRVLVEEGGEVNDSRDPGGHTNLGITQDTLAHARLVLPGLPASVADLTRSDALLIYETMYWKPIHGDELPLGMALLLFDAAVNQGVSRATTFLQQACNVTVDGTFGRHTLNAAQLSGTALLPEIAARRAHHYMRLGHLAEIYGLGWSRRLCRMFAAALAAPVSA